MTESEMIIYLIGGAVLLLVLIYIIYRMLHPVDKFSDIVIDDDISDDAENLGRSDIVLTAKRTDNSKPRKMKKQKIKNKSKSRSLFNSCEHNYDITGFPADRIGTHVNLTCSKCGDIQTVTIEESKTLLRQRDDVRQAANRLKN